MKRPLIVLTGPTAVGKTSLSIAMAQKLNCSIISADSMQVYRHMDIGSAKIRPDEMQGVRHYLVDVLDPDEEFHVVRFQSMAREAMEEIYREGKIPLVVGGTGFYIQALVRDIDFTEGSENSAFREKLTRIAEDEGADVLHEMLRRIDNASAEQIHPNNVKRVIRALEFYRQNGYPISEHNRRERERQSPYNLAYFVLTDDRQALYARIDERVDQMLEQGLVEEVRRLRAMGCRRDMVSMQGLGYKELLAWMDGECTLDEAVRILKRDTRHFAKRQLTWFRREPDVIWLDRQKFAGEQEILDEILRVCAEKKLIDC